MARKPRVQIPGGTFHVGARGALKQFIFKDVADREYFLRRLLLIADELGWRVLAYCLMGNHYHLVIETPDANLSAGMHRLNGGFAQRFNRIYGTTGHVFERRFWNPVIHTEWRWEITMGYVADNPVRAALCSAPEQWPWSSYGKVIRGEPAGVDVKRLMERFGERHLDPLAAYSESIERARDYVSLGGTWPG